MGEFFEGPYKKLPYDRDSFEQAIRYVEKDRYATYPSLPTNRDMVRA